MVGLGEKLLLDLGVRLGRSRPLGLKRNRRERVGGREGVQYSLGLRKSSERMLKI